MPIYEYQCAKCGSSFELLVNPGEGKDGARCPECGAGGARRQMSSFAMGKSSSPGKSACESCCQAGSCSVR